jgi:hypothetical protein
MNHMLNQKLIFFSPHQHIVVFPYTPSPPTGLVHRSDLLGGDVHFAMRSRRIFFGLSPNNPPGGKQSFGSKACPTDPPLVGSDLLPVGGLGGGA